MESLGQLVGGTWLGCVPIAWTRGSSTLIRDLGEVFGFWDSTWGIPVKFQKIHRNHVLGLQDFWVGNFEKTTWKLGMLGNVRDCGIHELMFIFVPSRLRCVWVDVVKFQFLTSTASIWHFSSSLPRNGTNKKQFETPQSSDREYRRIIDYSVSIQMHAL